MKNKLTFLELTGLVFDKARKPLSIFETWRRSIELGLPEKASISGKTPWKILDSQIHNIIGNPKSKFFQYGKKPTRFYLKKYSSKRFEINEEKTTSLKATMSRNSKVSKVLGYEIGATKVIGILGTIDGTVLKTVESKSPNSDGPKLFIEHLWRLKNKLINDEEYPEIDTISVTFPGVIDDKGKTIYAPNMHGWQNVEFAAVLKEKFKKAIVLENDANAHALAEKLYGAGRRYQNFVYFTVGSGIGGAIIIDNRLYKGHGGWAGEFGHMVIKTHSYTCGCGRQGCIEALASGKAIAKLARTRNYRKTGPEKKSKAVIEAKEVFEAKEKNNKIAIMVVKEAAEYMAIAIANIIEILDPEAIIIGGGITKHNESYMEQIRALVTTELKHYSRPVKIIRASETMIAKAPLAVALYHKIHRI